MGKLLPGVSRVRGQRVPLAPTSEAHHEVRCNRETAPQRQETIVNIISCRSHDMDPDLSPPGTRGHLLLGQMHRLKEGQEKLSPRLACGSVGESGSGITPFLLSEAALSLIPADPAVPLAPAQGIHTSLTRGEGESNLRHHSLHASSPKSSRNQTGTQASPSEDAAAE